MESKQSVHKKVKTLDATDDAIGEVDIQFVSEQELSAWDMYVNAIEERDKKELSCQDVDASTHQNIVKKLFEMALEAFEKELTMGLDCRFEFASCLHDFGMFIHVKEYIERACEELTCCLKTRTNDANLLLRRGMASIQLSKLFYNEQADDDEELDYSLLSTVQSKLQNDGLLDLKLACKMVSNEKQSEYALLCAKTLIDYAIVLKKNRILPSTVLDILQSSIIFIDYLSGDSQHHLTGTIHFHMASIQSHSQDEKEMKNALESAKKSTQSLLLVEKKAAVDYQLVFVLI